MQVIRHEYIDWEPVALRVAVSSHEGSLSEDVSSELQCFFMRREAEKLCPCFHAYSNVNSMNNPLEVHVLCEWMCEKCLSEFINHLDSCFKSECVVEIGDPPETDLSKIFPNRDRSKWVDLETRSVEFEDGRSTEVKGFSICRWPVTVSEFKRFTAATGYITDAEKEGESNYYENSVLDPTYPEVRHLSPAVCVSVNDVLAYCSWAGVRLPTEAEWIAASLIDTNVYSREQYNQKYLQSDGRHRFTEHPDALEYLSSEWVAPVGHEYVVRHGPCYVRRENWKSHPGRYICDSPNISDVMTSFRVVKLEKS